MIAEQRFYIPRMELKRQLATDYAWTLLGSFYSWGGQFPGLFDCSGASVEILKAVGLIGRKQDFTANGLYKKFSDYEIQIPYRGCLAFLLDKTGRAYHVEFCIDSYHTIGASGGGRHVKTKEDAIKHNAFVKVRPIREKMIFLDPFLSIR